MARRPNNGPSFSKAPTKKSARSSAPSPAKKQAADEQAASDAAWSRKLDKSLKGDPTEALEMLGLLPKEPKTKP